LLSALPSILEDRIVHLHLLTRYEAELQARGTKNKLQDSHLISLALGPASIYRDIIASSLIELETPNIIPRISTLAKIPLYQCPTHPHSQLNNNTISNLNTLHRPTSIKLRCNPSDKASRGPNNTRRSFDSRAHQRPRPPRFLLPASPSLQSQCTGGKVMRHPIKRFGSC
jgi:hypothetical protein